jgi:integrase
MAKKRVPPTKETLSHRHGAATTLLLDKSISSTTFNQYKGRIARISKFLRTANKSPNLFTIEDFGDFLLHMQQTTKNNAHGTAEGYRSSILHFQRTRNMWLSPSGEAWAESTLAVKMVKGYSYNGKEPLEGKVIQPTRATIEEAMLDAILLQLMASNPKLLAPTELGYRMALRPHQVCSLKGGALQNGHLLLPDKRANAANGLPILTLKKILDPRALNIVEMIEEHTPKNTPYFPNLNTTPFRNQFSAAVAAAKITMPEGLELDGPHTLRHGGMTHLLDILKSKEPNMSGEEICRTLQISPNMLLHYTRSNEERKPSK